MYGEDQMTERESLHLIQQMISTAKKEQRDDGRGWIVWGWLLFAASVLTVVNLHGHWFDIFFWNLFGLTTLVIFGYELVKKIFWKKRERVKTYTGDLFSKLNTGFFICLFFIVIAINIGVRVVSQKMGVLDLTFINIGFAMLINLYSFWILIYGTALNFRPSVVGAYVAWAFGLAALVVQEFEWVMVFQALAVLAGYIVPGHLANREFKRARKVDKLMARV